MTNRIIKGVTKRQVPKNSPTGLSPIGGNELLALNAIVINGRSYRLVPVDDVPDVDEDAADRALLAHAAAESEGHDMIPGDVADRLFAGENPIKVIREWRAKTLPTGMTQGDLAVGAGITQAYLSEIESGKPASAATYKRLAAVLRVALDIIMPEEHLQIFQLVPHLLDDDDWRASDWKKPVVIRAPSEKAARWAASFAFGRMTKRTHPGQRIPINPWRQTHLVEVKPIADARWKPEGPIELLDPPHHNDDVASFDWSNL